MERELATSAEDEADAAECLRRSLDDSDAGRVRLFSEVAAEWRAKYNLPVHLSDKELIEMPYTEKYCEVVIVVTEDKVVHKHPDGNLDHTEVRFSPTLNGYTDSYITSKCGGGFSVSREFDVQQIDAKILELREQALSRLHDYIDRVLDGTQSAPWLQPPFATVTAVDVSK